MLGQFSQGLFPIYVLPQSCNIIFNFYIFASILKYMKHYSKKDINEMNRIYRLNLINSCTGYKSANLIGTISTNKIYNVAVFSSITHLGSDPALLTFIVRPTTVPRDTYKNIIDTKQFTVNHINVDDIEDAHHTSSRYPEMISEFDMTKLEKEFKTELPIGVCHPGIHSPQTGLVKNAPNCYWLEKKPFQSDLRKALGKEVFCENDGNCFALSEAIDGAGKHYKIVYGIILGSGAGGGLVIDKQIVSGPNGVAGEWGHNQIPYFAAKKENFNSNNAREAEVESFISGLGMAKRFNKIYGKNLKTNEIFELNRRHDLDAERFVDDFKLNLAMSLSTIINILDPDAFIFGGGVSNEIDFLSEIENMVKKFVIGKEYDGVFLKPKFGDASGVRGAARLGRRTTY